MLLYVKQAGTVGSGRLSTHLLCSTFPLLPWRYPDSQIRPQ